MLTHEHIKALESVPMPDCTPVNKVPLSPVDKAVAAIVAIRHIDDRLCAAAQRTQDGGNADELFLLAGMISGIVESAFESVEASPQSVECGQAMGNDGLGIVDHILAVK